MTCTSRPAASPEARAEDHAPDQALDEADAEVEAVRRENAQLRDALASRATIEQAKGMLMLGYGLGPDEAFAVLRRWSQHHQVKLRVLAADLTGRARSALTGATVETPEQQLRPRPPLVAPLATLVDE